MSKKTTKTTKKTVNVKRRGGRKPRQLTIPGIPEELRADGNPVLGFRVPRGLLEQYDAKFPGGRDDVRELVIKYMSKAVAK